MNDNKTHRELMQFVRYLKVIPLWDNYDGQYLPEIERVYEETSDYAKTIRELFTEEYFAGNFELFERSLKYIDITIEEMTNSVFTFILRIETPLNVSDEYIEKFVGHGLFLLKNLKKHIITLQPAPSETIALPPDVSDKSEFDNSIKINIKNDTRRVMFLYEFGVIDHLQGMNYSNNQIGTIIMDLFELSENENNNRRINIGSVINKIQNKAPNNPYDSNAGQEFIADLEEKYEIKSRKKQ